MFPITYAKLLRRYRKAQLENGFKKGGKWRFRIHDLKKTAVKYLIQEREMTVRTVRTLYAGNRDAVVFRKHYDLENVDDYIHAIKQVGLKN